MLKPDDERMDRGTASPPAMLPDAHLVRMAQRDRAAFVHLYDRYVNQIYRYCARRVGSDRAEDITSTAFFHAMRSLDRFDPDRAGFRPWLFAIAHNALIDATRERNHAPLDAISLPADDHDLDEHVIAIDQSVRLEQAVAALPPDQFAVVSLRLEGLTGPEIAEATGKSHEAVRSLQHRAFIRLKRALGPDSDQHPEKTRS